MEFDYFHPGISVFGFVIAIVLIGSLFNYLQERSRNETLRDLAAKGHPIDPETLRSLRKDRSSTAGLLTGGFVTIAVAAALIVFGRVLGSIDGDQEVATVFLGISAFPGFVGIALLLAGIVTALRKDAD